MPLDIKKMSTHQIVKEIANRLLSVAGFGPIKVQVADVDGNAIAPLAASTFTSGGQKSQIVSSTGVDRSGVCGGTVLVTPSANAFAQPSFIECAGADGTITGVDEYGNTVPTYPMTVGKITPSRWTKVTAVTAGVIVWRHYSN